MGGWVSGLGVGWEVDGWRIWSRFTGSGVFWVFLYLEK